MLISCTDSSTDLDDEEGERNDLSHKIWDLVASVIKQKKSIAVKIARDSKTLLHHSGSRPFSYRLEAIRQAGSKFPEIDTFKEIYVRPGNETTEQLHAAMVEKDSTDN